MRFHGDTEHLVRDTDIFIGFRRFWREKRRKKCQIVGCNRRASQIQVSTQRQANCQESE